MPLPIAPTSVQGIQPGATPSARPIAWPVSEIAVPNLVDWAPGDILVMETLGTTGSALVEGFQQSSPIAAVRAHARWTHCAVYISRGLIVDSRPWHGGRVRRLCTETAHRRITVLRIKATVATRAERHRLAEVAAELEDVSYSYWSLGWAQPLPNGSQNAGSSGALPRSLICSALVGFAASKAGIALEYAPGAATPLLPAGLMVHPWLEEIMATWHPPA